MGTGTVNRDLDGSRAFEKSIPEYQDKMQAACAAMRSHIDDASPAMIDKNGLDALAKLDDLIKDIMDGLPQMEELHVRVRKANTAHALYDEMKI